MLCGIRILKLLPAPTSLSSSTFFSLSRVSWLLLSPVPISHRPHLGCKISFSFSNTQLLSTIPFGDFQYPVPQSIAHPWPELSCFLDKVAASGYAKSQEFADGTDELVAFEGLPEGFLRASSSCLSFSRDQCDNLGLLSRRDIKVVVENGHPFLFQNGDESVRRMKLFLARGNDNAMDTDTATMVDLMKFLLSYASNHFSSKNMCNHKLVEPSVRNLFRELFHLCSKSTYSNALHNSNQEKYEQTARPFGKYTELKRGDWLCPRCNFMNFARNAKCLECGAESRPKRQAVGSEWECPQCDFFNYSRNMVCLRCDCKRPVLLGKTSLGAVGDDANTGVMEKARRRSSPADSVETREENTSGTCNNRADSESCEQMKTRDLDLSEEAKTERWYRRIAQIKDSSELCEIPDEDFPSIMPLRKGHNRFVVSRRKAPSERRSISLHKRDLPIVSSAPVKKN